MKGEPADQRTGCYSTPSNGELSEESPAPTNKNRNPLSTARRCVYGHKLCAGNLIVALHYYSPPQWKHLD